MVDEVSIVCPGCGKARKLSSGIVPEADGKVLCAHCGREIPIPVADPAESTFDHTDPPASVDDRQVTVLHPSRDAENAEADAPAGEGSSATDSIVSALGDCGSGRYVERETIGRGGMGEIVLCVEQNTRREVAMKRMLPTAAKHARQRARFVEEAQVTAQLEHPNIVPVHELGRDEQGAIYFTMKLVKGRSLGEILTAARDGEESHSPGELLGIFLKVCDGVAFAHSRGVIHRDLKPANIMIGDFGEVLVMDWGVARILGREEIDGGDIEGEDLVQSTRQELDQPELYTIAGKAMGSPAYMSPEQAAGDLDKIDARSDIYSLGAILYQMLTLKRPVEGDTAQTVLANVTKGEIRPPEQRAPDRNIPRELSAVAMKCLSKGRWHRYKSVTDLQRDVNLYLEGRSVSAAPDTFAQAFVKLVKRNKGISAAVAAAAVILIALTTAFVIRLKGERDRAVASEHKAVAAQQKQRATALAASEQLAKQAVRAAGEGRFAEADVRADAAVKVMPDGPWGHYALGVVAFEKKDFAGARKHLEEATRLDPSHKPSRLFLGSVLAASGELAKWETLVAQAEQSTDWRSLVAAGDALMQAEKHPQARKAYQRATELIARQAAVPANVRAAVKDNLARATGCVKMMGFYESVRDLPAREQARRLEAKLKEIYGPGVDIRITVEKDSLAGITIGKYGDPNLVRWLDPLRGLPLRELNCYKMNVADLGPLRGMSLTSLDCDYTSVGDLRPLEGMPLKELGCLGTKISDLRPLKGMQLKKLNIARTPIIDLSPLKGMPLTSLNCGGTPVSDLGPLKGIPLKELYCNHTKVSDLTPLKGMGLKALYLHNSKVTDLSPLKSMPLTELHMADTHVSHLGPLKGMPLVGLHCSSTKISDLSPLKGMPLKELNIEGTGVTDLTPLAGMKLGIFSFTPGNITKGIEIVRGMKTIGQIGYQYNRCMTPDQFWKKYDAGEFNK